MNDNRLRALKETVKADNARIKQAEDIISEIRKTTEELILAGKLVHDAQLNVGIDFCSPGARITIRGEIALNVLVTLTLELTKELKALKESYELL